MGILSESPANTEGLQFAYHNCFQQLLVWDHAPPYWLGESYRSTFHAKKVLRYVHHTKGKGALIKEENFMTNITYYAGVPLPFV